MEKGPQKLMKRAMRRRPRRPRRDLDYRGQKPPADFSRFVYEVRRGKPGSLEVLQDLLETYFPKQFQAAKDEAVSLHNSNIPMVVTFNSRLARQRFMSWKKAVSLKDYTPFDTVSYRFITINGYLPAHTAVVWSSKTGSQISEKLRRLSRRRRAPFFDVSNPSGPRWYGRVISRYNR